MDFLFDVLSWLVEFFCWRSSKAAKEPEPPPPPNDDPRTELRSRYGYPP
jgi:hypothetical protein